MNQSSENLPLKKAREEYNLNRAFWKHDRRINSAKQEIKIFMNAANRIKAMEIDTVTIDYLQEALQSVLNELQK